MLTMNRRKIIHMTSHRGNQGSQDFRRPFCQRPNRRYSITIGDTQLQRRRVDSIRVDSTRI